MIRNAAHFFAVAAGFWSSAARGEHCAHVARYYIHLGEVQAEGRA